MHFKNKVIAIDCDEVLCDTISYIFQHSNFFGDERYDNINLQDLSKMYHTIHEQFSEIILSNKNIYSEMSPVKGAVAGIKKLYESGYQLYVITGRTENMREFTKQRLEYYFPGMIREVFFCNNYKSKAIAKVDFCRQVDSELMIDDDPRFIDDISHIPVLLFDKPWNKNYTGTHIQRVFAWEDILDLLLP